MRILALILSCYITILAFKPCVDESVGESGKVSSIAHDESGHTGDLCSPFCICACCGAYILNYAPLSVFECKNVQSRISTSEPYYESVFFSRYIGSIWQPPQIA